MRGVVGVLALMAAWLIGPSMASAQPAPLYGAGAASGAAAVAAPAPAACTALSQTDFGGVLDAPTQIMSAKLVEADKAAPARCQITGYIMPNVGFELWLPATNWNGKFVKLGCGGYCGMLVAQGGCPPLIARGYACIAGNMGHISTPLDAKWAANNVQTQIDFGFRSIHVTALAGKAITAAYYGQAPVRSYHLGCSTGGREGMVAAQKFPLDFDGIAVGAPPVNETGDGLALMWNVLATLGPDGKSVLSVPDIHRLHAAAMAACDMDDGVKDGVIGNPMTCKFDPASLQCKAGQAAGECFSPAQVAAVRKIYGGPVNSKGEKLYTSRALPGSELNWINTYIAADGGPSVYNNFMRDMMRYMNFTPALPSSWKLTDFNWDRDPERLDLMEAFYAASNPDLRRFKARGGKMIVYQGLADQSVLPENIIDYYGAVERAMGGRAPTQEFVRLFLIPGMNHCAGGEGAHMVDYLTYLENWVEQGKAPDMMLAKHTNAVSLIGAGMGPGGAPVTKEFTRPLYPYPLAARYDGKGDPNDAASFKPR